MKKLIFSLLGVAGVIIVCSLGIFMYNQSGFAVKNQYYNIVENKSSLKKVCKNRELYKFIRKNYKSKVDFTDNQGSGHDFYYVASYGKKAPAIGVEGKFVKSGSKITNIFDVNKQGTE